MVAHVIKLQAPFERLKGYSDCPDVSLRRAVILQAIIDSTNMSQSRSAVRAAKEAKEWLFSDDPYFTKICFEAELEPETVVQTAREMIALQNQKYYEACRNVSITAGNMEVSIKLNQCGTRIQSLKANDNYRLRTKTSC